MCVADLSSDGRGGTIRLGELLVQSGVLTAQQRDQVLVAQKTSSRPFGELAEKMFGINPVAVENAWARQYASNVTRVNPMFEQADPEVLRLVGRRQAWQFRVLPLRRDGDEIMVCTTPDDLVRALKFLGWQVRGSCYMVLAEPETLCEALAKHYPMAGLGPKAVRQGVLRLAQNRRPTTARRAERR